MSGLMTGRWRSQSPSAPSPISPALMRVVENVLGMAWRQLLHDVASGEFSLCNAKEDDITAHLYYILGTIHARATAEESWGYASQFETPAREGNLRNHDNTHPDRQPDLTFRPLRGHIPTVNSTLAAIFVECKPIDGNHPVTSAYCDKGLARFETGEYAWSVDRGMMVAYVRNHCRLPEGLRSCISQELTPRSPTAYGDAVYQSLHTRTHPLAGNPVGPITVHHLWLHPPVPCEETKCRRMGARI